jgi:hypothetical protein
MSSEEPKYEYSLRLQLKSTSYVKSDYVPGTKDYVNGTLKKAILQFLEGKEGSFQFPVSENITYVPFRSIEYVTVDFREVEQPDSAFDYEHPSW